MKRPFCIMALGLLSACSHVSVQNTTPRIMATNAAETYPLSMRFHVRSGDVDRETVRAKVIVDGKARGMRRSGFDAYIYEYAMPKDHSNISYYFDIDYVQRHETGNRPKSCKSNTFTLELSNRYVLGLDSTRGTPGTRITVIGRGFGKDDVVMVGSVPAETHFESATALQFFVPALPSGSGYLLTIANEDGSIPAGKFRIDSGSISAVPRNVDLHVGERVNIVLTASAAAPEHGLPVDITTDIPDAICVEDTSIPRGRCSINFMVEGVAPAEGTFFVNVEGFRTLAIPICVRP
ncbi:MAG: IPT/TIG domain-containing protein [Puniceicoccales bacterium]|jgi:hypothetical protein|nr:IPT/TIG domain-containing protein [Puniceicoccales bacterium]